MSALAMEPHAYIVEALWNQGPHEFWRRAMDMDDVTEPLSLDDAESLLGEMIEEGHEPTTVRIVALTVVAAEDAS